MVSSPHQDAANFNHLFNRYTHNPDAYNPSAFFPFEIYSAATVAYADLLPDMFFWATLPQVTTASGKGGPPQASYVYEISV